MALAQGSLTLIGVGATTDSILAPAATGGSGSVTYQYYRSTSSGFTPGSTNLVAGATSLQLNDSNLTPGTIYYYKVVATDSTAATASSAQLTVTTTAQSPGPNQFTGLSYLGMLDLRFNGNTISVQFDATGSGTLTSGQAVKFSTTNDQSTSPAAPGNGIPLVVPCTAASDVACGFVNYDIKSAVFNPGDRLEISMAGNVMFLYAALALSRGQYLTSLPAAVPGGCNGGVVPVTGSSGYPIVGYSLDTGASGSLVRVFLQTPPAPYAID